MKRSRAVALFLSGAALVVLSSAVASPADHRYERKAFTKEGQAFARTILVKRSDLPAGRWKTSKPEKYNDHEARCPGLWDPDLSNFTLVGEAESLNFETETQLVSSTSGVYETPQQARAAWRRQLTPGFLKCAAKIPETPPAGLPKGVTIRVVSAGRLAFPSFGEQTAAYRIVGSMELGRVEVLRTYGDLVIVRRGRAIAAAAFEGFDKPVRFARMVVAAVDRRMKAAGP